LEGFHQDEPDVNAGMILPGTGFGAGHFLT
jgi:hypothetical protein